LGDFFLTFVRFVILMAQAVPISLYVTLEVVKVAQCRLFFDRDARMAHLVEEEGEAGGGAGGLVLRRPGRRRGALRRGLGGAGRGGGGAWMPMEAGRRGAAAGRPAGEEDEDEEAGVAGAAAPDGEGDDGNGNGQSNNSLLVPFTSRTTTLNEELGQIEYVLTDKTGTLTQNVMGFVAASVAVVSSGGAELFGALPAIGGGGGEGDAAAAAAAASALAPLGGSAAAAAATAAVDAAAAAAGCPPPAPSTPHRVALDPRLRRLAFCGGGSGGGLGLGSSDGTAAATTTASAVAELMTALSVCNTVVPTATDDGRMIFQATSPDEEALVMGAAMLGRRLVARGAGSAEVLSAALSSAAAASGVQPSTPAAAPAAPPPAKLVRHEVLAVLEFTSDRKRMAVAVRRPGGGSGGGSGGESGGVRVYVKGADNVVLARLKGAEGHQHQQRKQPQQQKDEGVRSPRELLRQAVAASAAAWGDEDGDDDGGGKPAAAAAPTAVDDDCSAEPHAQSVRAVKHHLARMSSSGLRTLVVAKRDLSDAAFAKWAADYRAAAALIGPERESRVSQCCEALERDLELLGATAVEDKLQEGAPEAVEALRRAGIRVWVLTGDKVETAVAVARSARLLPENGRVLRVFEGDLSPGSAWLAGAGGGGGGGGGNRGGAVAVAGGAGLAFSVPVPSASGSGPPEDCAAATLEAMLRAALAGRLPSEEEEEEEAQRGGKGRGPALPLPPSTPSSSSLPAAPLPWWRRLRRNRAADQHAASPNQHHPSSSAAGAAPSQPPFSVVIDGGALALALRTPRAQDALLSLLRPAASAVCCRVSPMQKAQVAAVVKARAGGVCLAIGDGANDVSMLQAAHVGCGLAGREGRAAVQAADFAFGQFRFLSRLILVHGRQSFLRNREVVLFAFYKNIAYVCCYALYSAHCGLSAQSIFYPAFIATYNAVWSAFPTIAFGLFEQDASDAQLLAHPGVYAETQRVSERDVIASWVRWALTGLWHGVVAFYVPTLALTGGFGAAFGGGGSVAAAEDGGGGDALSPSLPTALPGAGLGPRGESPSVYLLGAAVMTSVVLTVTAKVGLRTTHWTALNLATTAATLTGWFIFLAALAAASPSSPSLSGLAGLGTELLSNAPFWLSSVALAPLVALLPDFFWASAMRQVRPTGGQLLAERRVLEERARRKGLKVTEMVEAAPAAAAVDVEAQRQPAVAVAAARPAAPAAAPAAAAAALAPPPSAPPAPPRPTTMPISFAAGPEFTLAEEPTLAGEEEAALYDAWGGGGGGGGGGSGAGVGARAAAAAQQQQQRQAAAAAAAAANARRLLAGAHTKRQAASRPAAAAARAGSVGGGGMGGVEGGSGGGGGDASGVDLAAASAAPVLPPPRRSRPAGDEL
jgi:magnesium-transporting ATPase (P-type)